MIDAGDTHDLLKPVRGWKEISQALLFVESLFTFSKHTLAGVEVYQQPEVSTTRIFLRTLEELDDYLKPIHERMALDFEEGLMQTSYGPDLLSDVFGRIVLDYPYDVSKSLETTL